MAILASPSALALPPASRTQLSILKPSTTLDSSDEARTDASASPSMNPERSPSATSSDTSVKDRKGKGASALSSSAKRRKEQTTSGPNEDKPAPKQRKYERKTKRFIWPDDLHRLFVAAIFDVGLKNASPKALLSLMEAAGPNAGLTTEHLKSHLQKYRLNYERSRAEFLEYYDRSAKRNLKRRRRQAQQRAGGASGDANTMFVFPISNSKHRKGDASDSDSDDSDSDGGDDNNNSMDVDAQELSDPQWSILNSLMSPQLTGMIGPGGEAAITGQPIDGPVAESAAGGLAAEAKSEDDAMDLYRWDRIDLNVGLDDDDLFGFLKA
ncbi:hypothetical protein BBO99_00007895 [Phytophthora kernoviae]|uniref:HTH myb-type domain-containing protein n=2 Tax=Phytophthora kernoviae TaxID=325452 RepID=A0A3R7JTU6_9STRA|nr:hypothetical protein G195_009189 [Phytophthora kernoviae 00238/432]KAG2515827.1 hypothetical protein JM16_007636 [Phytophthora kernoviae]KAG2518536.1 hypothetical protein JM18_007700 [Phytophthora kernoviae]RLN14236.1 hypothetical protein BBI17_007710 [Phytophthora kernoviae]RLN76000.1 hypothetical protein BBO99_00007895 [Phytophthora kernoviae]